MKRPNEPEFPLVFETFRKLGNYERGSLQAESPSCFNCIVSIRKYRITVEVIDEPKEVLIERLKHLWDNCDNHHHVGPLKAVGKELGIDDLQKQWGWIGSKRKVAT